MAAQTQPPSDNIWVGELPPTLTQPDLAQLFEQYGSVVSCRLMPPKAEGQKACAMIKFESVEIAQWVVDNLNGNIPQGLEEAIICRFANAPGWKEQMQAQKGAKGGGGGGGGWQNGNQKGGGGGGWQQGGGGGGGGGGWQNGNEEAATETAGKGDNRWQPYGNSTGGGEKGGGGGGGGWGKSGGKGKAGGKGKESTGAIAALHNAVKETINAATGFTGGMKIPDECTVYVKNLPPDTTDCNLYQLFAPFGAIPPTGVKAMLNDDGSCKGIGFVDFVDPAAATTAVMALNEFTLPDGSSIHASQKLPSKKAQAAKGAAKAAGKGGGEAVEEAPAEPAAELAIADGTDGMDAGTDGTEGGADGTDGGWDGTDGGWDGMDGGWDGGDGGW